MRVLLTTDTLGGVWTFTSELSRCLLERGDAVALVSFGRLPSAAQAARCAELGRLHGSRFRYVASAAALEWMQDNAGAYTEAAPLLLEVAASFAPDVVHSSQFCFGSLPLQGPVLVTAHSDVFTWAEACEPAGLPPSAWLDRYRGLVEHGLEGAALVIAPTRWMLDALRQHFNLHMATEVIANGVSTPAARGEHPRRLQAVSAGRLWDQAKGIALLAQLNSPVPIVIAGSDKHEESAPDLGSLKLAGELGHAAVLNLFSESSIYLAASLYEPFGLAPVEAALCGCAVVARAIPSLREVWQDAALYFSGKEDLEQLLTSLVVHPRRLQAARCRSRARALRYTSEAMTGSYVNCYLRMLAMAAPIGQEALAQNG